MSSIKEVPCIAYDIAGDREYLDWDEYRTPHHLVLYGAVGWCLAKYRLLGHERHTSTQLIKKLSENLERQEQVTDPDELFDLRAEEKRMRERILQDFIAFICAPSTEQEFDRDRTSFLFQTCTSALLYSIAHALPDRFENPRHLMMVNSWDYVEGFLKTYNNYCSPSYDIDDFTNALARTAREYFRRFQFGLREGKIRLDPRYRHHFRASLLDAFDKIRIDIGSDYWMKEFPLRDEEERLPETRCYELNDRVYDWDCEDDLPADNRIVLRQPYAPLLEAHHITKLKVFLNVLEGFQRLNRYEGLYSNQIIALLICFHDFALTLLSDMDIPKDQLRLYRVAAHSDRTAICYQACQSKRADNGEPDSESESSSDPDSHPNSASGHSVQIPIDLSNFNKEEVAQQLTDQMFRVLLTSFTSPKQ